AGQRRAGPAGRHAQREALRAASGKKERAAGRRRRRAGLPCRAAHGHGRPSEGGPVLRGDGAHGQHAPLLHHPGNDGLPIRRDGQAALPEVPQGLPPRSTGDGGGHVRAAAGPAAGAGPPAPRRLPARQGAPAAAGGVLPAARVRRGRRRCAQGRPGERRVLHAARRAGAGPGQAGPAQAAL
ncbi:unnamed protein product, partial [Heterosigma akashiwo]